MNEMNIRQYDKNVFEAIGKQWMLISVQQDGIVNTMTASWGGMGVLWNKNVATIYVRPQRYTKQFLDRSDHFSLSFFDESWRKQLSYLGSVSGKDEPKIERAGLLVDQFHEVPYFKQAELVMICRKLYVQELKENCFYDCSIYKQNYPLDDLHVMYIGEIEKIFVND